MVPGSQTAVNCDYMITASLGTQLNPDLWDNHQPSALRQTHCHLAAMASNSQGAALGGSQATIQQFSNDGILPDLHGLCHNPHISQSVSQILSAYDAQTCQESIQGKPAQVKKSVPQARWPNEGYFGVNGKKIIAYDELSLPRWAVGQFYHLFHIQDPTTARHGLLQVILAHKDATSLSGEAVRSAWGNSMEQSSVTWEDSVQWSLNRLSASQIAMVSTGTINPKETQDLQIL